MGNRPLKILIAGDTEKAFIGKLDSNQPNQMSFGIDYVKCNVDVRGKSTKIHLWDCPTLEMILPEKERYLRHSAGAVIVYDITDYQSYESAHEWLNFIRQVDDTAEILLVGNRHDLPHLREVSLDEVTVFAEENNIAFVETSTETNMVAFVIAFQNFVKGILKKRCK